ncbi:hypothetical protein AB0I28_12415 [Phytomonospora sp. NPDC050363]|uniref:hypothetical protein n=1 Tax=Phytomonospora sp. NPDC050363 TaxID=3155642 RepID=UPI0033EA00E0
MTCHEFAINLHDLTADQHARLINLLQELGELVDPNPLVSWRVDPDGCLHCRPAREDLRPLPAFERAVLGGFVAEHTVNGQVDINAGEGP